MFSMKEIGSIIFRMELGHRLGWIKEEKGSLLEIGMRESGEMERDMVFFSYQRIWSLFLCQWYKIYGILE